MLVLRVLVAMIGAGILFVGILWVFFKFIYKPRFSLVFMGESPEFEKKIDQSTYVPVSELSTSMFKILVYVTLSLQYHLKIDIHSPVENLIKKYPKACIGYLLNGFIYRVEKNEDKAIELYNQATDLMKAYPNENKSFESIFPTEDQYYGRTWRTELKELVPNTIWVINGPFRASPEQDPIDLQSSLVRLEDGEIIIINPLPFSDLEDADEIISQINQLGKVSALITPCSEHGIGIESSSQTWPEAFLFGTDIVKKHGRPNLPWKGFLHDANQLFLPDLQHFRIEGQAFKETLFYHKGSKTLLGLTDLGISCFGYHTWAMPLYTVCFGLWRGPFTSDIGLQSYQYVQLTEWKLFRESWQEILKHEIDVAVLGHSGILNDPIPKIRSAFHWILNTDTELSTFERFYLPAAWVIRMGMPSVAWNFIKAKYFK